MLCSLPDEQFRVVLIFCPWIWVQVSARSGSFRASSQKGSRSQRREDRNKKRNAKAEAMACNEGQNESSLHETIQLGISYKMALQLSWSEIHPCYVDCMP